VIHVGKNAGSHILLTETVETDRVVQKMHKVQCIVILQQFAVR